MKRARSRPPPKRRTLLWAAFGVAAVAAYVVLHVLPRGEGPGVDSAWLPPRPPRSFPGVVRAGGEPVAGALVELFEDADDGFATEVRTGADGTFTLRWQPTGTVRVEDLFVAAEAEGYGRTLVPARPAGTTVDLGRPVSVSGVVAWRTGEAAAGAEVRVALRRDRPGRARAARADGEGRFALEGFAVGSGLDLLALVDGAAPAHDARFRAGEPVTLHVGPGRDVALRVRDREGAPVPAARARGALPRALQEYARVFAADSAGRIALPAVSDGGGLFLAVEADGFLPVEVPVWPRAEPEAVLWAGRAVDLVLWDGWNRRAVEEAAFEINPSWGDEARLLRRSIVRPAAKAGLFRLLLPPCRTQVRVDAPGYAAEAVDVAEGAREVRVSLTPPRSAPVATLVLRATPDTPDVALLVADGEGRWMQETHLREGRAELAVPPGRTLQLGSIRADAERFVHKHEVKPLRAGERRAVAVGSRPAVPVTITLEPPLAGELVVVDKAYERFVAPFRVPLEGGRGRFWAPPLRTLKVSFEPPGNWFPWEGVVEAEHEPIERVARPRRSAALQLTVRDPGGRAVPFAAIRLWEPGLGGQMELRLRPRDVAATAEGELFLPGLRGGNTALEVSAPGFRTWRTAALRLRDTEVVDFGVVALEPEGLREGRVVGPDGAPLAGVHVRVLSPRVRPLPMPGGGQRDVYDLQESSLGDALTGPDGRFAVRDASPRAPLIALHPPPDAGLCDAAFVPGSEPAEYILTRTARVQMEVPSSLEGVYVLVGPAAVLVKTDPPLGLRPLPLQLPEGKSDLYVRLHDGRWAAPIVHLKPGNSKTLSPDYRR